MSAGFDPHDPPFSRSFLVWKLAAAAWCVALVVSHVALPSIHVWGIAAVFSILMNATYPIAALQTGRFKALELAVAGGLILASVLGVVASPIWVICAIFAHGLWDIFKHQGVGVRFMRWYTNGCAWVDFTYAGALLLYFLQISEG